MKTKPIFLACVLVFALEGCASMPDAHRQVSLAVAQTVKQINNSQQSVVNQAGPYLQYERVPIVNDGITAELAGANFIDAINAIAKKENYSVMVMDDVNRAQTVNLVLHNQRPEEAIRNIAFAAGYVAVFNPLNRTIDIAKTATYTFRVPNSVMENLATSMTVGGSPVAGSSSGSGSSGAGGMPSVSTSMAGSPGSPGGSNSSGAIDSNFMVSGHYSNNMLAIKTMIQNIAGQNARVNVVPELGMITVDSNAQALRRVDEFLTEFSKESLERVQIEAAIVEVSLNKTTQYGIDWKHILGDATFSLATASTVANPAGAYTLTSASTTSIINALRQEGTVKIVSQPRLMTLNHIPAVLFDGTQVPYVANVESTIGGTSGLSQQSGSVSFATDGLSLSLRPDILNKKEVQISIVPVLSTINSMQTLNIGNNTTLTAPNQSIKQSFVMALGESGKTIIFAGSRSSNTSHNRTGLPGVTDIPFFGSVLSGISDNSTNSELVILVHTDIIPAPHYDPLVMETI
ncbi:MAG: hypothetical protein KGI54_04895 [Pseudomonadota bacterium]|nr:hypothetical protein [Pseudomonadota bacterium]